MLEEIRTLLGVEAIFSKHHKHISQINCDMYTNLAKAACGSNFTSQLSLNVMEFWDWKGIS